MRIRRPLLILALSGLTACGAKTEAQAVAPLLPGASTSCHLLPDPSGSAVESRGSAPHLTDGVYPDPKCSPGATSPEVAQDDLPVTICRPGWAAQERDGDFPSSTAARTKLAVLAAYGIPAADKSLYELDHVVPIEVGGAPGVTANLFPEPLDGPHGARAKDKVENRTHDDVCAGRLTLAAGQAVFLRRGW